jgi:hypothetical protein
MSAFNVVRFKIKPGMEDAFLDAHRNAVAGWAGLRHANIIAAGEGRYCIIAEWDSMDAMAAARPQMIATLDSSATRWPISAAGWASPTRFQVPSFCR